jgi:hypothetical protein
MWIAVVKNETVLYFGKFFFSFCTCTLTVVIYLVTDCIPIW